MARTQTEYRKLKDYDVYLRRFILDKENFTVSETSFTKKIRINNMILLFNENGEQDSKGLQLINKVRRDAADYDLTTLTAESELNNVWFDLSEKPANTVIAKVDVKSAYWETALKLGVISDSTNAFLHDNFAGKELKKARLKALGSLATRKLSIEYVEGRRVSSSLHTQITRELYLYICSMLDDVMQAAIYNINGAFYYYWDCVFVSEQHHKEVMAFLDSYDYGNTVELTNLSVITLGDKPYIVTGSESKLFLTDSDIKEYPIPPDKKWLLNV